MSGILTSASWDLAAHTAAKLEILGSYLRAWFPILSGSRRFERIIYIDGFAGPGRYKLGQDGSPIIALKAALGALSVRNATTFEFHFVERKRRVAAALSANIEHLRRTSEIPENIEIYIYNQQTFEEAYEQQIRTHLGAHVRAPAFALVDPFGWKGIPMRILAELMQRPSAEILVNFMFEEINRFINHPEQRDNFDALFACQEWRNAFDLVGETRKKFIHDLYRDRLRTVAGAKFVRSFEMRNKRNASDYFLFFASNNQLGLAKMKEAMWRVDPGGDFMFSDATNFDQAVLFEPQPDRQALRRLIAERFAGRLATIQQIENFVVQDTPFHTGHYRKVLSEMEADQDLKYVQPSAGRRRGTYADKNAFLQFR